MIAPTVAHLSFERDDGQPLAFIPGQFIQIHFEYADGTRDRAAIRIAVTGRGPRAGPDEAVEIAVSYVPGGAATALFEATGHRRPRSMPAARSGASACMPDDANRRYLLIGTGTGVTPYRAMLPQLAQQMRPARRRGGAAAGRAHAGGTAVRRRVPRLRRGPSRASATCPACRANCRQPAPRMRTPTCATATCRTCLPELAPDPATDIAYLCGNPDMVDACFEALKARWPAGAA